MFVAQQRRVGKGQACCTQSNCAVRKSRCASPCPPLSHEDPGRFNKCGKHNTFRELVPLCVFFALERRGGKTNRGGGGGGSDQVGPSSVPSPEL